MNPTLVLAVMLLQSSVVGNSMICSFGEKLRTSIEGHDNCIICEDGTFMSEESHTNRQCYECTRVENPTLEIETAKCNRTHDAAIDCICGYHRHIARRKGEKDECKPNVDCPSSSSFVDNTTVIGVAVDADKKTEATSLINSTLDSGDRKQLKDAVTESQKRVSLDFVTLSVTCVTLIVTLASTFYNIFWNDKPNAIPCSIFASCRFTTHRMVTCCALLSVALIACILFKTINTHNSDVLTDVIVVITLSAAEIYIALINMAGWARRPSNKPCDKANGEHTTQEDDHLGFAETIGAIRRLMKSQDTSIQLE